VLATIFYLAGAVVSVFSFLCPFGPFLVLLLVDLLFCFFRKREGESILEPTALLPNKTTHLISQTLPAFLHHLRFLLPVPFLLSVNFF
jgi:hypothetical protein